MQPQIYLSIRYDVRVLNATLIRTQTEHAIFSVKLERQQSDFGTFRSRIHPVVFGKWK